MIDFNLTNKGTSIYFFKLEIDSAQFRNLITDEDFRLLKGKIVVLRTCVDECYKRCINRWIKLNKDYTEEELEKYKNKKLGMYKWYKSLNKFIENLNMEA